MLCTILLHTNLVNLFLMSRSLKKFLMMLLWMSIAGGIVISLDTFFQPPDELSGVLYFLSIGVAASATLNYYR